MNNLPAMFLLVDPFGKPVPATPGIWKDVALVIGATAVLGGLLFLFVATMRRGRHHRHHHHSSWKPPPSGDHQHRRRRRRRHHHEERPLNPTLAETGGLPKRRDDPGPHPQ